MSEALVVLGLLFSLVHFLQHLRNELNTQTTAQITQRVHFEELF
jgi:hypothetical protein